MQKKNSDSVQRAIAEKTATIFNTCAVGMSVAPMTNVCGNTLMAAFAMPMSARPVKAGGPTAMNMPILISRSALLFPDTKRVKKDLLGVECAREIFCRSDHGMQKGEKGTRKDSVPGRVLGAGKPFDISRPI